MSARLEDELAKLRDLVGEVRAELAPPPQDNLAELRALVGRLEARVAASQPPTLTLIQGGRDAE